jgi:hypothetical protein
MADTTALSYTPTTWADGADGGTAITAARLNNIEQGVSAATTQVNANTKDIKTLGDSVSHFSVYSGVKTVKIGFDASNNLFITLVMEDGSTPGITFNRDGTTFKYW